MKALVRWATGKRLTNRLPYTVTLSPPLNSGILGLRMGPYVPTPRFFYNLWGPRESDSLVLEEAKYIALKSHREPPVFARKGQNGVTQAETPGAEARISPLAPAPVVWRCPAKNGIALAAN